MLPQVLLVLHDDDVKCRAANGGFCQLVLKPYSSRLSANEVAALVDKKATGVPRRHIGSKDSVSSRPPAGDSRSRGLGGRSPVDARLFDLGNIPTCGKLTQVEKS